MSNSTGNTLLALITGVAIGAGLGILLAPEKGSVTRKKIKNSFDDLTDEMKSSMYAVSDASKQKYSDFKENLHEQFEDVLSDTSHKTEDVIVFLEKKLAELKEKNAQYQK
jgi:gas vesicle protein